MLWAIDYPYETMEPAVRFMDGVQIANSTKRALYSGNAERLFRLS